MAQGCRAGTGLNTRRSALQIIDELRDKLDQQDSIVRAQLMREDIARLEKLLPLADSASDLAEFKKTGTYIGWTQNDMMTHRLSEPLSGLLDAIYNLRKNGPDAELDQAVNTAWAELCIVRNKVLFKCL